MKGRPIDRHSSARAASLLATLGVVLSGVPLQGSPLTSSVAALADSQGRVAFVANLERPEHDVYAMNADGTDVTRLTTEPSGTSEPIDHPVWSPNGQRIAFTSNRSGNRELYTMDGDGSDVDRVTHDPALDVDPAWSPDGTRLVFARGDASASPVRYRIVVADADGSDAAALTGGSNVDVDPAWSPNGARIAFIRDGRLTVMNANGSGVATLVSTLTQAAAPAWSPDGLKLAFSATASGRSDVYTIGSTGSGLRKLTGSSFAGSAPRWSPDGARIVFVGKTTSGSSIATILPDGSCPAHVRHAPAGKGVGAPDWQSLDSAPLFVSSSPGCRSVTRGAATSFGINLGWSGGRQPVSLAVDGLPPGAVAKFGPNPAWLNTATLTVSTSECGSATPVGTYTLTITGWNGPLLRTTTVNLVVRDGVPKPAAPVSQLQAGTTQGSSTTPVRTTWSACSHDGVRWYRAARQVGNDWKNKPPGSATSVSEALALNTTHRYRARAGDAAYPGGRSGWAYGPSFQPRLAQESSTAIVYGGAWAPGSSSSYSGGGSRYTTAAGASATYSFVGSSVGWVAYKDRSRGAAQVYVDGEYVQTVDLNTPTPTPRSIVFTHSWPTQGRHTIRIVALGTEGHPRVELDAFVTLFQTAAFVKNTYNGRMATERPENITCVSASALTWSNHTWGTTSGEYYSHTIAMNWYREVRSSTQDFHNRYDYTGIEPGLDPRGWAWLLWKHAPPGRSYHDYWSSSQSTVNSWIMWHIRNTGEPAGAITFRYIHAVDVVGFSSSIDPRNGAATLNGFFIVDPWYPNGAKTMKDGGRLGLVPNTYVTLAAWNRSYFLPYVDKPYEAVHGRNLWHGKYVAVLRAANGSREPNKTNDTMPATFSGVGPAAPPEGSAEPVLPAGEPVFADSDALGAVEAGIAANGLSGDERVGLGSGPVGIGRRVNVESLSPDMPPYSLVELVQDGDVVALAMLVRSADGLQFAGLQPAFPGNELTIASEARRKFGAAGFDARSMRLVWRPSADSMAPFSPFWRATDGAGRQRYLTPEGEVTAKIEAARAR